MPADVADVQAGALTDLASEKVAPVSEKHAHEVDPAFNKEVVVCDTESLEENYPTLEELEGENCLRRISAPIPWAVYTVAFVELCERFSYYGTQVVCMCIPIFWSLMHS
jgi:POT family proton-dependent oligopeptide transporter